MTSEVFKKEIERLMVEAKERGCDHIDIISREVHINVGGYPGNDHRMPSCCEAMYEMMKGEDVVLETPPSGKGAKLKIRYKL